MTPTDTGETSFPDAVRLYQEGRSDEAEATCAAVLHREPRHSGALLLAALLALQRGDAARAADLTSQAIALNPNDAQAFNVLSAAQIKLREYKNAEINAARAAALKPALVDAHCNRATALNELKRYTEALESWDRALALKSDLLAAHIARADVLEALGRHQEALPSFNRAIAIAPSARHYNARAVAQANAGVLDAALKDYDAAIACEPDFAPAHMNRGVALLQLGRLKEGWQGYEWRWRNPHLTLPDRAFAQPQWAGEDIAGKTILLHNEQGFGDALQFCRYIPLVAARGARVVLEVQKSLVSLLAPFEGVAEIVTRGAALPAFDVHCPLLSLPHAFGTTLESIPAKPRYISPDSAKVAKWRALLSASTRPRIGLAWSGNPAQSNDANRSIPLAGFLAALPEGFDYVSLQKDVNAADKSVLLSRPDIHHFGAELADFSETAALTELMDEVVTVCTSAAHLAGALGKSTRVLLCFNPCWRWLLGRDDSPWYPSLRLYRQDRPRDWAPVLERVRRDLCQRLTP